MHRARSLYGHLLLGPSGVFDQRILHLSARHKNLRVSIIQKLLHWRWRKNKEHRRQAFLRAKQMYPNHLLHLLRISLLWIPAAPFSPHYALWLETRSARNFPNGVRFLGNQSWLYTSKSLQRSMYEARRDPPIIQDLLWWWFTDRQLSHHQTMHKRIKGCQTSINDRHNLRTNLACYFSKYMGRFPRRYVHHHKPVCTRRSFYHLVTA